MMKSKYKILCFIFILGLVACAPPISVQSQPTERLTIYSGRSETLVAPIIEEFTEETGIQVEVLYGSSPELVARLLEEDHNSPADVFFAQTPGGLQTIANAGLFDRLPGELLNLTPFATQSIDGTWIGISGRIREVVYNVENVAPGRLPDTLQGFTDPVWRGRVGLSPTNGSFQVMVTAMRQIWGEKETIAWLEDILANEPIFYEEDTPIVAAVAAGEVDVGFVNHYDLYHFLREEGQTLNARNHILSGGGPGSLLIFAGVGQLTGSDRVENAQTFIKFLLSNYAQQYFANIFFEYPVIEGLEIRNGLIPLTEINFLYTPPTTFASTERTIVLLKEAGFLP